MIVSCCNRIADEQRGTLIIELALVVGIMAFTAMCGLEVAHYLQKSQSGLSLSRLLADSVARDCYDVCDSAATRRCAVGVRNRIAAIATSIDETMQVRLRVWQRRSDNICLLNNATGNTGWQFLSIPGGTITSPLGSFVPPEISMQNSPSSVKIIAEVEAPYASLTGFAMAVFGENPVWYHGAVI